MEVFWTTFWLIFVAEIADKSRVAGLALVSAYRAPLQIFFGMTLGYMLLEGLAVAVGQALPTFIPMSFLNRGVAILFIVIGIVTWFVGEEIENEAGRWLKKVEHWGAFLVSFLAISVSEMGDRTQIAASALSAESGNPLAVYAGAMTALILLNIATVWLGNRLLRRFPQKSVHRIAALIFILVGCAMLFG